MRCRAKKNEREREGFFVAIFVGSCTRASLGWDLRSQRFLVTDSLGVDFSGSLSIGVQKPKRKFVLEFIRVEGDSYLG